MSGLIIFLSIVGLILYYVLFYLIIRLAFEKENKYQKIQTAILAKIAKKAGVPENDIDDLFRIEKIRILH